MQRGMVSSQACAFALLLAGLVLLAPVPGGAAVALDQVFDDCGFSGPPPRPCTGPSGFALGEGFAHVAQTVTAGITGRLRRIDLHAVGHAVRAFELFIIEAPGGVPNGHVLSAQIVELAEVDSPWKSYDLLTPVHMSAGESFAIDLHPVGVEGPFPGKGAGSWGGGSGNPYARGKTFVGITEDSLIAYEQVCAACLGFDNFFRTYVETSSVPLPSTLAAMVVAAVLISLRSGRPRSRRASALDQAVAHDEARAERPGCEQRNG